VSRRHVKSAYINCLETPYQAFRNRHRRSGDADLTAKPGFASTHVTVADVWTPISQFKNTSDDHLLGLVHFNNHHHHHHHHHHHAAPLAAPVASAAALFASSEHIIEQQHQLKRVQCDILRNVCQCLTPSHAIEKCHVYS
jgi:hypothetical protein